MSILAKNSLEIAVVLLLQIIITLILEAYVARKRAKKDQQEPRQPEPADFVDATSLDEDDPSWKGWYGIEGKEKK